MSVRVNLLPREIERREAARRARALAALVAVLVVAGLAALYWWQLQQVNDRKAQLAAAEQRRDELQAEVRRLDEFARLEQTLQETDQLVATAMARELSLAGLLQDIAAVMPTDAALTTLTVTLRTAAAAEEATDFGQVVAAGESLNRHAPGLERLLLAFEKVAGFRDVFFTTSTLDEEDIATFTFDFFLGPELLTGRYLGGVPEELR